MNMAPMQMALTTKMSINLSGKVTLRKVVFPMSQNPNRRQRLTLGFGARKCKLYAPLRNESYRTPFGAIAQTNCSTSSIVGSALFWIPLLPAHHWWSTTITDLARMIHA